MKTKLSNLLRNLLRFEDADWSFDPDEVQRFYKGKPITEAQALNVIEDFHQTVYVPRVDDLCDALADGQISLGQWQQQMAQNIKDQHIASAVAGRGSRDLMTAEDWGRTGGRLKFQYQKLDGFAREIELGEYSPEYIKARARMYGRSTRTAYWDTQTKAHSESEKYTEERRLLGAAEHCDDCVHYQAMGWQPIGTLPEPGSGSRCLTNCQCVKEYR